MIKVNGVDKSNISGTKLSDFLEKENYNTARIAVEINKSIIPKNEYCTVIISGNDDIQIVSFVGGG